MNIPPTQTKPLIAYVRVSSKGDRSDETFHSPKEQADRARAHADSRGYVVGRVIEDIDVSGGTHPTKRPGMAEALELVRAGQAGGIVSGWLDRLSRDPAHGDWLVREVTKHGGVVTAPDMPEDITSPTGEFTFAMLLGVAKLYRRTAGARLEGAKARAILAGVPVGQVPVGYKLVGHPTKPRKDWGDEERKPVLDPELAPVIRELFEHRAQGEGWGTLRKVLSAATGREWSTQGICELMRNRFYVGELRYGEVIGPGHEPIVDEALFAAANNAPNRPRPTRSRDGKSPWLLTGIATCHRCGNKLVPWTGSKKQGRHRRYRCNTARCRTIDLNDSRRVSIDAEALEREVVGQVFMLLGSQWQTTSTSPDLAPLESELEKAARLLAQASSPEAQEALGDQWLPTVSARRAARDKAATALGRAQAEAGAPASVEVEDLRERWDDLTPVERKEALSRYLVERVIVRSTKAADAEIEFR